MVIKLTGNWQTGYAYDKHTEYSHFVGYDEYGNALFDTKRTIMGELIYQLKYQQKLGNVSMIAELLLEKFSNFDKFDMIIPAPFSTPRTNQPVELIAQYLANHLNIEYANILRKVQAKIPLKNIKNSDEKMENLGYIELNSKMNLQGKTILLLDDLYSSGTTLNQATQTLLSAGASEVCVLALTKTRS